MTVDWYEGLFRPLTSDSSPPRGGEENRDFNVFTAPGGLWVELF